VRLISFYPFILSFALSPPINLENKLTRCKYAVHEPKMWDNLKAQFMNHLDDVNEELKKAGLPSLEIQK
jgi:hypothetical protein